jgi:hypothetical protein
MTESYGDLEDREKAAGLAAKSQATIVRECAIEGGHKTKRSAFPRSHKTNYQIVQWTGELLSPTPRYIDASPLRT